MKKKLFIFAAVLTLCLFMAEDVSAYERKVLFEDFTACDCPPCATCAAEVEAAIEAVGDLVVPIAIHLTVGNFDPWWEDNSGDASARASYYGVQSIPRFYIDGAYYDGARQRSAFRNAIENRGREDSPMEINLIGFLVDNELNICIDVTSDEDFNSLHLYVALTEDHVEYQARNGLRDHYDAMVKMMPNGSGTRFSIDANETLEFEFTQNMNGLGWHELEEDNLLLVCWVQASNREVLQAQNFSFMYAGPHVLLTDWWIDDTAEGNGDGRSEPGETVDLIATFSIPENYMAAESIEAHLTCEDEEIEILEGDFEHGELQNGETTTNEETPFRFRVDENLETHPVTFLLSITALPGEWEIEYDLTIMLGWPDMLLIDVTENEEATEAMMELFGSDELPYVDRFDFAEDWQIPEGLLDHYKAVIWHSFNSQDAIHFEFEEENLSSYLDDGNILVMSSIAACVEFGDGEFFRDYLGAELTVDPRMSWFVEGYNADANFEDTYLFLGAGDGAGYPYRRPKLNATGDGVPVLYYSDNGDDFGVTGIEHETDTYRTLLLSFPIESIGGAGQTDSRASFMARIWNWIEGGRDAPLEAELQPVVFVLDPAYPNPFNSSTIIPFSIDRPGDVTLRVYDLAGREVARLISGVLPVGHRQVSFNASDMNLTTGLYYVRLSSASGIQIRKVLYMR